MKRILILGGGIQQLPAIRAARDLHIHTTVFDRNPKVLGKREANAILQVDIYDEALAVEAAQALHDETNFDGVMTMGTDCSITVARIAEALNLPGIGYETAVILKDKAVFREFCSANALPVPLYKVFSADAKGLQGALKYFEKQGFSECVLKPTKNMGSRGVCIVRSKADIERAFDYTLQFVNAGKILIEERVSIPEYSVDAFVLDGSVQILGIADRYIALDPNRIELGHVIPSHMDSLGLDGIKKLFEKIAKLLKVQTGALKGDIFYEDGKIVIGELAGRLSGGYMSGWTIPLAYEIEPAKIAVLAAVGKTLRKRAVPKRAVYAAEQAIISMPGIIQSIEGSKQCLQKDWCKHIFLLREIGTPTPYPRNNTEKVGNILFTAATRKELEAHKQYILEHCQVHLAPCNDKTTRFLFFQPYELDLPSLGVRFPAELQAYIAGYNFSNTIGSWSKSLLSVNLDLHFYTRFKEYQRMKELNAEAYQGNSAVNGTSGTTREEARSTKVASRNATDDVFFAFLGFLAFLDEAETAGLVQVRRAAMTAADILLLHAMERGGRQALHYIQASVRHDTPAQFTQLCYELYLQRFS